MNECRTPCVLSQLSQGVCLHWVPGRLGSSAMEFHRTHSKTCQSECAKSRVVTGRQGQLGHVVILNHNCSTRDSPLKLQTTSRFEHWSGRKSKYRIPTAVYITLNPASYGSHLRRFLVGIGLARNVAYQSVYFHSQTS